MTLKICKLLFLLLIVSLPLVRPFNAVIFGLQIPATDFIFIPVFVFWMLALVRGETTIQLDKIYFFIGLYALSLTVSSVFSIQPQHSFFKLLGEFYLFALAVLTFNLVREKSFIKQIVFAWLFGTGLTILATIAGFVLFYLGYKTQGNNYFLSHFGSLPAGNYPRIHALFANANMMCNFLNVSLMLTILAERLNWLRKFWARILQIGIWFAAIFTFSAGLGGMCLSLGIWYWAVFKAEQKKDLAKIALSFAIISAILIFGATLISPNTNNTTQDFSLPFVDKKLEVSVRVIVWENALETFRQFPFIGKGTGTDAVFVTYETLSGNRQILLDAHNNWLNVLAQTGLLGIISFVLLNLYLTTNCTLQLNQMHEQNYIHIALSCAFLGAFLYQGLSGSFEDARHLWVLFGLLVGIAKFSTSKNDISEASTEL
jgi:putative inorganic carbon (hco3(-)) transporter